MAKQIINTGTAANDRTGDTLRSAFTKSNANFTELYTAVETIPTDINQLADTGGLLNQTSTGDITFSGVNIIGALDEGYQYGVVQLTPNTDYPYQAVSIYPTFPSIDQSHIHISASGPYADLFLGNDSVYASVKYDGSVELATMKDVVATIPSITWIDRGGRLNINYGWDWQGIWFTGDANTNLNGGNYPIVFSDTFAADAKTEVSFNFVFNDNCADISVAFYVEGTSPQFSWSPNTTRIACQYDCEGLAQIYGRTGEALTSISLVTGNTYRTQVIYDPNNTPNVTFNTYDDQDNLLYTVTLNETLPAGGIYSIGFTADQDETPLRTYMNNLAIILNDSPYYSNSLTGGDSGKQNVYNFDVNGGLTIPLGWKFETYGMGWLGLTNGTSNQPMSIAARSIDPVYPGQELASINLWPNGTDGQVTIAAADVTSALYSTWTFNHDGSLQLPANGDIKDSAGNSVLNKTTVTTVTDTGGAVLSISTGYPNYGIGGSNACFDTNVWTGNGDFNDIQVGDTISHSNGWSDTITQVGIYGAGWLTVAGSFGNDPSATYTVTGAALIGGGLDLTKSVHRLADGDYILNNGTEGQILYLVPQTGTTINGVVISVANGRVLNDSGATTATVFSNILFNPFGANSGGSISNAVTMIFTDGAWQSSGGSWD